MENEKRKKPAIELKAVLKRILFFFVSNMAGFAATLVFVFIFGGTTSEETRRFINIVSWLLAAGVFPIAFYKLYFLKNISFQMLFEGGVDQKEDTKQIMLKHLKLYGKQDLIWLLVLALLPAFIPVTYLSKTGIPFILASYSPFSLIPVPVLPAVLWVIYVAAVYIGCLWLAYRKWDKLLKENTR